MSVRSLWSQILPFTCAVLWALMVWCQPVAWAGGGWPPAKEKAQRLVPVSPPTQLAQTTTGSSQSQLAQSQTPAEPRRQEPKDTSEPFYSLSSMTAPGNLEFGVIGGEPLGLSAKLWLSPTRAIDAGLGWSMLDEDTNLQLHADYLFHNFDLFQPARGSLPVFYGMGARFRFGEDSRFGFRVPMGVEYITAGKTLSLFLEAGPVINFIPTADVDVNFGLGIRFFFFQPDKQAKATR